jgi:ABC-2 type transport system ATP-binding protein
VYGRQVAVDNLSLTVPQGAFFGFLGPNGAGKTTTVRMLIGLARPDEGSMDILGLRYPADELAIKRRLGVVLDDDLLFDQLTGAEYVEFAGRMYGLPKTLARRRAAELIRLFELDAQPRKLIAEYSKGMRKRTAFAAALIHRPRLFILDEPFEGVDAVGARLMKDILQEQVRNGATVFLTSHVLEVVERLCDSVAIIHQGRLLHQSPLRDMRQSGETLEEIFVRLVGGQRSSGVLEWL